MHRDIYNVKCGRDSDTVKGVYARKVSDIDMRAIGYRSGSVTNMKQPQGLQNAIHNSPIMKEETSLISGCQDSPFGYSEE